MVSASGITVIICTHNPPVVSWSSCIQSVSEALIALFCFTKDAKLIIVDSCSDHVLTRDNLITPYTSLPVSLDFTIARTEKAGLTLARQTGVSLVETELCVFVDDDNILAKDYLIEAINLFHALPCLGVVGPGHINVLFDQDTPSWLSRYSTSYQQKSYSHLTYGCVRGTWEEYFPPGTGMCIRSGIARQHFINYSQPSNRLYLSDRTSTSLSSGGDSLIVYDAIKLGYAVGIAPSLSLTHFIVRRKANLSYLLLQGYNVYRDGLFAQWIAYGKSTSVRRYRSFDSLYLLLRKLVSAIVRRSLSPLIETANHAGVIVASHSILGIRQPLLLLLLLPLIRFTARLNRMYSSVQTS